MDLSNYVGFDEIKSYRDKKLKIFFYRICGTGMGAAACLMKQAGHEVEGADLSFSPPMSTYLESSEIPLFKLQDINDDKLREYDLIVVGNSVPRVSDFAAQIERSGSKFTSFPTLIGGLELYKQNVVGIAGTHGKTTTTFYLTQLLEKLNQDPGYFIGGIIEGRAPSQLGSGNYFVIESDEYDSAYFEKFSKFQSYEIDHLILTSLEFDHADIFNSIDDIKNEFKQLLSKNVNKSVIYCSEYEAANDLFSQKINSEKIMAYGDERACGPYNIVSDKDRSFFELKINDVFVKFETNIIGLQNIYNLSACLLFLINEGFELERIKQACLNLSQVKRRQELRGMYKGHEVIDDFAHHPRAVSLTIDSIRKRFHKDIVVIFDPISATARSSIFQNDFIDSLSTAKKVILTQNNLKTTAKLGGDIDLVLMQKTLENRGVPTLICSELKNLRESIDHYLEPDSLLLVLSNRTCLGLWESSFVEELT